MLPAASRLSVSSARMAPKYSQSQGDPEAVLRAGHLAKVPRNFRVSRGSHSKDSTLRCMLAVIGIHISGIAEGTARPCMVLDLEPQAWNPGP